MKNISNNIDAMPDKSQNSQAVTVDIDINVQSENK